MFLSLVQRRVYGTRFPDIDELQQHLLCVWHGLEQSLIDDAVDQWPARLPACVHPMADILNVPYDYQFVLSEGLLDEFYASHHGSYAKSTL